jgi:acyl-CoA synthetase (AMP-forming)/AMP-acid ligase II
MHPSNPEIIDLERPESWPKLLVDVLVANHQLFLDWERRNGRASPQAYDRAIYALDDALREKIKRTIRSGLSPRHVPAKIVAVADIPRTRSGKITELAVRDMVHGREVKNTEALANPESLAFYKDLAELRS